MNKRGERFVNEGASDQDMPRAFGTYDPVAIDYPNEAPVWMVFDHRLRESTMILSLVPGGPVPEWVVSAPSVGELAVRIGVDPGALQRTLDRFSADAAHGEDPDFHRGTLWWEAFMSGGPSPEKCLGPVEEAPFYAVQIYDGTGNPGRSVGRPARPGASVPGGGVVEGLYAAGNVSACVFGPAYPGGGATLGPALTFGFLAGRHVASRAAQPLEEPMVQMTNGGRRRRERDETTPCRRCDEQAVAKVLYVYAERIDAGDFEGLGDLFAEAEITFEESPERVVRGRDEARQMYEQFTRRYPTTAHRIPAKYYHQRHRRRG